MLRLSLVALGVLLLVAACGGGPAPAPASPTLAPSPTSLPEVASPPAPPTAPPATSAPTATLPAVEPAAMPAQTATPASAQAIAGPVQTPAAIAGTGWEVEMLLVAPGEPGRLYALIKNSSGPLWAFPASDVRLMISDDFAKTWVPFPGGLPVPPECVFNVNLDYYTPDALFASTCQGLYVWEGNAWAKRSDNLTDVVAIAFTQPNIMWAAVHGDGMIRSDDGGKTWRDASTGLVTFGGMANLGFDPRDNRTLYGIIQPRYAGSYLRRGTPEGRWDTMPTPENNATIETGMTIDGGTGALYLTTQVPPQGLWRSGNPNAASFKDVTWDLVHEFDPNTRVSLLASGWGPQGLAIYANIWPNWFSEGGHPILHRSLDGGYTWEALATPYAPPPAPTATTVPTQSASSDWQTYSNPAGFSIRYPHTWSQEPLPDQNNGAIHGVVVKGAEGGVELYWGVGFGGACPSGYQNVKVAQGELQTCYSMNADGTESWDQISKELDDKTGFSARAYTSNADPASHDLILQVLSTLSFP